MALLNNDPFAASPPLTHEQLRAVVTARRVRYFTLGYEPIPVVSGRKRPALDCWDDNVDLLNIAHEHLPLVDKALAQHFITEASTIMERAGWIKVDAQGRPKNKQKSKANGKAPLPFETNEYCRFALKDECAALAA